MTIDSTEWLKNNQENKKTCVPLGVSLTEEDCIMTKAKYKDMFKYAYIDSRVRFKKLFYCSAICKGICTDDSKQKIGEDTDKANREEREQIQAQRLAPRF